MKIAFLGTGRMTEALASRWKGRHEVFIGGRDADKARALAAKLGSGVRHGSLVEAAAQGEVVVLATTNDAVFATIDAAGGPAALAGKVLVDINNPVRDFRSGDFLVNDFDGRSLAEAIAARVPGAPVVKAFNMCQAKVWELDPPMFDGRRLAALYCGDDAAAKGKVAGLIADVGAEPVDVGELRYARLLEAAAAIVIKFLFSGRDPRTVLNLIQPERKPVD
jgi:predicted dinucleotide-binding enzyme